MKTCTACNTEKPLDRFHWQNKAKGTRRSICKECKSAKASALWASGRIKEANYEAKRRRVNKAYDYLWNLYVASACADCGESNPLVLEFDHLGEEEKSHNISQMLTSNYGLDAIKKEIEKCEIVCANCHKIRTARRANHWRHQRYSQLDLKT